MTQAELTQCERWMHALAQPMMSLMWRLELAECEPEAALRDATAQARMDCKRVLALMAEQREWLAERRQGVETDDGNGSGRACGDAGSGGCSGAAAPAP